ncbi:centrosomal protein CEP57L1 [Sphaeramia orbicularis]|uniref:centrosomal protein CEP57L1 n=1 Tax=Sphaeramia orbicularis TaxID=375764 RepID=UPI00117C5FB3|nr:centrosomal protein CEP57L1 [Sphaeramia orbicularis]
METYNDQISDSPSKNSYIGSYYQPPDKIITLPRRIEFPAASSISVEPQITSPVISQTKPNIDNKAVVDALKTLQEKIKRLELERKQAQKNYHQFSQDAQKKQQVTALHTVQNQPAAGLPQTDNPNQRELGSKLQSAEARCKVLEKQLDYMRKMVENAKKDKNAFMENQASLQNQQPSSRNSQTQSEKLEKLESEYLKLSRTQTLAEMKLAILEQNLLKEQHERKLVQEKADELQKELEINLQIPKEDAKPKKKTKKHSKKTSKKNEPKSPSSIRHKKMPFVAGTSTSPSHSVHANVQSILHMMKHHQPQLCERVSALHRSGCTAKKSLQKDFCPSSIAFQKPHSEEEEEQSVGSLSDLLLALQDELGQMSFEHQELVRQIDETDDRGQRQDLQNELERVVMRMEEKGAQITKLRKHQQMVHKLTHQKPSSDEPKRLTGIIPPLPSPVKPKQKVKKGGGTHSNLQLLRETQKFRNSLKQSDLSWET